MKTKNGTPGRRPLHLPIGLCRGRRLDAPFIFYILYFILFQYANFFVVFCSAIMNWQAS